VNTQFEVQLMVEFLMFTVLRLISTPLLSTRPIVAFWVVIPAVITGMLRLKIWSVVLDVYAFTST
jgi:hypothetical protein